MPAEHDLVVVGAGTAGCVIAARVTEAGGRVLLLEAGPDYPDPAALPRDLADGNRNSVAAHDWGLGYLPKAGGRAVPFPRGKVVGGSSAVNTCIALRGEPADYDEWASIAGDDWSFERCLPAFRRLETDHDFGHAPAHGADGPLPIARYPHDRLTPIQQAFLGACAEAGYQESPDHNEPGSTGFGRTPMNKRGDRRVSLAEAYLTREVRERLTIRAGTLVRRVAISRGAVTGVDLADGSRVECPSVALCAGAVMTPPLLVRSGIGPRETLERLAVTPVAVRDGVGARLLDHPGTMLVLDAPTDLVDVASPLMQCCTRTTVFERNDLFLEPMSFVGTGRVAIAVAAYRSHGAGRLLVESADPAAGPRIESHFYADGADAELMAEGLRRALALAHTDAIRAVTSGVLGLGDDPADDDLRAHVLRFSGSGYHPCGTVPMGDVVDARGRIDGVRGLTVADASIMPVVPRCNINIPTAMIGERFGEWLAAGIG